MSIRFVSMYGEMCTHYMAAQHAFMDQPCHTSAYTYGCSIALLSPVMVFCFFPCLLLATEEGQKKAEWWHVCRMLPCSLSLCICVLYYARYTGSVEMREGLELEVRPREYEHPRCWVSRSDEGETVKRKRGYIPSRVSLTNWLPSLPEVLP